MTSTRRYLPAVLFVIGAALMVAYLWLGLSRPPLDRVEAFTALDVSYTIAFGMFLPMGAFIAWRRPESPIGWIASVVGLVEIFQGASWEYGVRALIVAPGSLPLGPELGWVSVWTWALGFALVGFLLLLFPTGRLPSRRWKWVAWTNVTVSTVLVVGLWSTWPQRGIDLLLSEDPDTPLMPAPVISVAVGILFLSMICAFISVIVRFRRSRGIEREQLKWMAFVAAIAAVLIVASETLSNTGANESGLDRAVEFLLNISAAGVPIAMAIAILRYRLYDIDLIINRTLVYGTLTAVLAATYIGLVFLFQRALAPVTQESDLAIAASTLAVAALFRPARERVQAFIDHRFYRRKFDAQLTVERFNAHLRDEVDLSALSTKLTEVVAETMQPAHVSLWIRSVS